MLNKRPLVWMKNPENLQLILLGVTMALVFSLGFNALVYIKDRTTAGKVHTIVLNQHTKDEATYNTCLKTKPANTAFVGEVINAFRGIRDNAAAAYKNTPKSSVFHDTRRAALVKDQKLVKNLQKFLPIQCVPPT